MERYTIEEKEESKGTTIYINISDNKGLDITQLINMCEERANINMFYLFWLWECCGSSTIHNVWVTVYYCLDAILFSALIYYTHLFIFFYLYHNVI